MDSRLSARELTTRVWTVGHSTRTSIEFEQLLLKHEIGTLVDVRSFPSSKRFPHFNQKRLAEDLLKLAITYRHLPALGGRRQPNRNSENTAWKNASFRAYADYMETPAFAEGVRSLIEIAGEHPTAIMCAEALWWKCHRGLIADYLKASGVEVIHIVAADKTEVHPFTPAAKVIEGKLSYKGLLD